MPVELLRKPTWAERNMYFLLAEWFSGTFSGCNDNKVFWARSYCLGQHLQDFWRLFKVLAVSPPPLNSEQLIIIWSSFSLLNFLFCEGLFLCSSTKKFFWYHLIPDCIGKSCLKNLLLLFLPADFSSTENNAAEVSRILESVGIRFPYETQAPFQ